jgi:hypothetical protein
MERGFRGLHRLGGCRDFLGGSCYGGEAELR